MRLRTFDGEKVRGKITTEYPISTDGSPVLVVNDEPYDPEDADFFLESASQDELEQLEEGGYNLPRWKEREGDERDLDEEVMEDEGDDD